MLLAIAALAHTAGAPDPERGDRLYQQCYSCHALAPGKNLPSGPTLHDIVGKPIAAESGFDYSPALRRFARGHPRWTRELLDGFIADPEGLVPGTHMSFHGIASAADRSALIDYLESPRHSSAKALPAGERRTESPR